MKLLLLPRLIWLSGFLHEENASKWEGSTIVAVTVLDIVFSHCHTCLPSITSSLSLSPYFLPTLSLLGIGRLISFFQLLLIGSSRTSFSPIWNHRSRLFRWVYRTSIWPHSTWQYHDTSNDSNETHSNEKPIREKIRQIWTTLANKIVELRNWRWSNVVVQCDPSELIDESIGYKIVFVLENVRKWMDIVSSTMAARSLLIMTVKMTRMAMIVALPWPHLEAIDHNHHERQA